jgi:hypothetical protein
LRVISGRERDDAAPPLIIVELRQRVERATKFEGAHALEIFAFEKHFGAEFVVDRARGQDGSAMGGTGDALGGCDDVVESRQGRHGGDIA